MIIPDVNLLLYAHDEGSNFHAKALPWWVDLAKRAVPVALPWVVALGFIRIATHPRIQRVPIAPSRALDVVEGWLQQDHIRLLEPGPRHLLIVRQLFEATGVAANLTTDAHLAALAIEHGLVLASTDGDFARFAGVRFENPLAGPTDS